LLAVTKGLEIGVDLERIDPAVDHEKMAAQFFSPGEKELLAKFSKARRRRAFYRIWTRKEASLKCLGYGFSAPKEAVAELSKRPLCLSTFPLTKDYIGSLAAQGDVESLRRWQFAC
jgi:4'-phosphopantetheinyl transferase